MYHMHCLKPHNASIQPPNGLSCNHTTSEPIHGRPKQMQGIQQQLWGASLVQVACPLYKWQVVVVVLVFCFNSYQSQFTLHPHLWWSSFAATCTNAEFSPPACTGVVSASIWCEKVPDNHPLHTPIMTSPLDLEPGCCFMQELKKLDCLQTAHLVIHVQFIVISCTLPCISLTWVHHMHCLGTPARISRHLPTLYSNDMWGTYVYMQ